MKMKKKQKNKRINTRGLLISALVIAFFVGVIMAYYSMLYSETRSKIVKNCELTSATSSEQVDKYLAKGIDSIRLTCYTLDSMIRSSKPQSEILDFLVSQSTAVMNTTLENSTGIYGYINGEYLDGSLWVPDADYVATQRPWYLAARANVGRVAVVDPYIDAETGSILITFAKTLCDAKSVAAMDFSMDRLQSIAEEIASDAGIDAEIVLDQKYQIIAHSDRNEIGKNYLFEKGSFGSELIGRLRTAEDDSSFSLWYKGKEYIVYTVTVSNNWKCLSVFNATEVFSQLKTTLVITIIISLLVIFILMLILIHSGRKREQTARMQNVVGALAAAIDAKDAYTNGHSGRVAEYAREIGRRSGFSQSRQEEIYMMGLLHDVGKIGIPDAVINKPGKLTKEEYDIIKTHSVIGSQILSQSAEMTEMAVGARWHHERYDGTGYPDGLSGNDIRAEARIIAVADAYDAMTSKRSYRKALSPEEAAAEIEKGKGGQFDPAFADVMLGMIKDGFVIENKENKEKG